MSDPILELRDLKTHFAMRRGALFDRAVGVVRAVDGVSLQVAKGEILGLVGESGCGKSTLARTVAQLVPATSGAILLNGVDLVSLSRQELRRARCEMQMVFQDPYASLNPRMTVFDAIAEPIAVHKIVPKSEITREVSRLMEITGLAARYMRKYPHEFSGGQRQRIAIARALSLRPKLILADEPVSALDVSVQAQILNLLGELRREMDLTIVLISHDLSVVRHLSHRIAVMYLGKIVELGPSEHVFARPAHPYTQALLEAIPVPDPDRQRPATKLKGEPPSPTNPPSGCAFHPRCPIADPHCAQAVPGFVSQGASAAACFKA
jgi:oligopeptide transport system ATP-binding protein